MIEQIGKLGTMLNFKEALEQTSCHKRIILLGNGFSESIYDQFNYQNLFDVAKGKLDFTKRLSSELIEVFYHLDTYDFEKVLAHLKIADEIIQYYGNTGISDTLKNDLKNLRNSFIQSIFYIHPLKSSFFNEDTKNKISEFLSNFSDVFTTNYDLFLYWIINTGKFNSNPLTSIFKDGFGYTGQPETQWLPEPIWINNQEQNTYYLHGALHIFHNTDIYKIRYSHDNPLVKQVSDKIDKGDYPIVVFEGKYKQKLLHIKNNPYLRYSYEQLKKIKAPIFIFGSSLNIHSDQHIIDAIKNSEAKLIYIGLYNENDDALFEAKILLEKQGKKVYFFDSKSAISW